MDHQRWSDAVAATIRAERAVAGLTQEGLADKAGIPRPTFRRYESGERRPTLVQIAQIADALGMSVARFAAIVEDRALPQPPPPGVETRGGSTHPARDKTSPGRIPRAPRAVRGAVVSRRTSEGKDAPDPEIRSEG